MQPDADRRLYKFSGPTEYALENLENGVLFCQHYSAYNDPFEFWSNIYEGIPDPKTNPGRFLDAAAAWGFSAESVDELMDQKNFSENVEEYFEECQHYAPQFAAKRKGMRIACFGSEADNLLMWSHYADGLHGFCIVLDDKLVIGEEPEGYLLDVAYMETPPSEDSMVYEIASDQHSYSRAAIEETKAIVKYQGIKKRQVDMPLYKKTGAKAVKMMHDIWQHAFGTSLPNGVMSAKGAYWCRRTEPMNYQFFASIHSILLDR